VVVEDWRAGILRRGAGVDDVRLQGPISVVYVRRSIPLAVGRIHGHSLCSHRSLAHRRCPTEHPTTVAHAASVEDSATVTIAD
jgi:hypothetical protein